MTKPPPKAPALRRAITPELIRDALGYIAPDVDRDTWARVGMAIKSELSDAAGFDLWNEWSARGESYDATNARDTWRSIKAGGRTTIGTLFGIAKDHGFKFPETEAGAAVRPPAELQAAQAEAERLAEKKRKQQEAEEAAYRRRAEQAAREAVKLWAGASEVGQSPYLQRKGVKGHGVRFLADGTLLVPMRQADGTLQNVQRIAPHKPTLAEAEAGKVEKRFLPGGRKSGLWHMLGDVAGAPAVLVAEGYATAATLHEATGRPVAVAFDAGNLVHVAKELRALLPGAVLLICGDDDQETEARTGRNTGRDKAATAARAVHSQKAPAAAVFPDGLQAGGSDFNDLAASAGPEAVRLQIEAAMLEPAPPKPKARRAAKSGDAGQDDAQARPGPHPAGNGAPEAPGLEPDEGGQDDGAGSGGHRPGRDPFELGPAGVYFVARDADGNEKPPLWLCAPLRVTARTRADDANGWGCLLEFHDLDGNAKTWAMPSSLLSGEGAEWAARLRDMGLQMAPGTRARNLVAQYIDTRTPAERVTCTDRVGWHQGGVYVLPSGCIGGGDARQYVFQSESGMEDTFRRAGELADWQRSVGSWCERATPELFLLCAALLPARCCAWPAWKAAGFTSVAIPAWARPRP